MKVSYRDQPDSAKIWVYQAGVKLSPEQIAKLNEFADAFLDQWESHNIPVQGSIDVINELFVRVSAYTNEPNMCGRAQDAQMRLMKELEEVLNVTLTDRMLLAFETDESTKIVHLNDIPELIDFKEIEPNTSFYNNLVHTKTEFENNWKVSAGESWLERYF